MGQSIEGIDKRAGWPEAPKLINPTNENFNKLEFEQQKARIKELESLITVANRIISSNAKLILEYQEDSIKLETENKQLLSLLREVYNKETIYYSTRLKIEEVLNNLKQ